MVRRDTKRYTARGTKQPSRANTGESSKIGVCNVNERLQLFFGSEAAMKYYSEPGKRTMVMLVLPIVREKGDADAEA